MIIIIREQCGAIYTRPGAKSYVLCSTNSDGHDKPFCTKAITIIDNFKKALGNTATSQFLKTLSIIDKLSPMNYSNKCCGKFLKCLTKFSL